MLRSPDTTLADSDDQLLAPAPDSVGGLARRGASWTFGLLVASQLLNVATTAVLSRLLIPSDFGLTGMVATFTALLGTLGTLGLSMATVQRRTLTMTQVHNLFWINTLFGAMLGGLTAVSAPLVAAFYGQPELKRIMLVYALSFVLSGLGVQPIALLKRRMQFRSLSLIDIGARICGSVAAISAALLGLGYWALVVSPLMSAAVGVILVIVVSGYRPRLPSRDPATLAMLQFGGLVTIDSIVGYFGKNLDNVLVGRVWGAEALGYYSRAFFLMTLPTMFFTGAIAGVMVPALSALQHDRPRMAGAYYKAVRTIAFGGFPVAAGLAIAAPEAIRFIYGPDWGPVVPIVVWFSGAMLTALIVQTTSWLYTATGHVRQLLVVGLGVTLANVVAYSIGVRYSPAGVAAAHAIVSALLAIPLLYVAHRIASIQLRPTFQQLLPILNVTVVMALIAFLGGVIADRLWGSWPLTLATKVVAGAIVYGAMSLIWLRPLPLPIPSALQPLVRRLRVA